MQLKNPMPCRLILKPKNLMSNKPQTPHRLCPPARPTPSTTCTPIRPAIGTMTGRRISTSSTATKTRASSMKMQRRLSQQLTPLPSRARARHTRLSRCSKTRPVTGTETVRPTSTSSSTMVTRVSSTSMRPKTSSCLPPLEVPARRTRSPSCSKTRPVTGTATKSQTSMSSTTRPTHVSPMPRLATSRLQRSPLQPDRAPSTRLIWSTPIRWVIGMVTQRRTATSSTTLATRAPTTQTRQAPKPPKKKRSANSTKP